MFPVFPRCPKCGAQCVIKEAVGDERYKFECLDSGHQFVSPLGYMDVMKELRALTSSADSTEDRNG